MSLDSRIADVVAGVFNTDPASVSPALKIGDIAEWDSLGQLNLIIEIERAFGTKFDGEQLITLNSLAEIRRELGERNLLAVGHS